MSWAWNHTEEAYENARQNVQLLAKKTLICILQEKEQAGKPPSFRLNWNPRNSPKDVLADMVWQRMLSLRTCDNGGHNAWCCPYGCHTVSFDKRGA